MNEQSIGSLCTGIGGLDAAVPGSLKFVAESNQAAAGILRREHPGIPNFGDITITDWNYRQHHVDVLTSGDPCQSMSAAGRQLASDDERFLWPYVIDMIRKTRPDEIFLENVQNIVSVPLAKGGERGGVLKMRLDDLSAAGYAARWAVLGACAVGAPHHRHRWFLRARYVGAAAPAADRVIVKCGAPRGGGRVLLPTPNARDGGDRGTPTPEHALRRAANPERSLNLEDAAMAYLLPIPRATDGMTGGPSQRGRKGDLAMGSAVQAERWGKFADAIALWEKITGRPAPAATEPAPRGGRRLNAALSEWMMGLPRGYVTDELGRNDALRCTGNGVVTLQARAAWDLLA